MQLAIWIWNLVYPAEELTKFFPYNIEYFERQFGSYFLSSAVTKFCDQIFCESKLSLILNYFSLFFSIKLSHSTGGWLFNIFNVVILLNCSIVYADFFLMLMFILSIKFFINFSKITTLFIPTLSIQLYLFKYEKATNNSNF